MNQIPDFLFIAVHCTCYTYCDKTREKNNDYYEIGRIYYSPLRIQMYSKDKKYKEVEMIMKDEYNKLSKMQSVEISATGQTAAITI